MKGGRIVRLAGLSHPKRLKSGKGASKTSFSR
jgi:hypothetical protein